MLDNKVILIGYSGHAYVVADVAFENKLNIIGYTENSKKENNPFQLNYIGNEFDEGFFDRNTDVKFIIGIGENKIREKTYNFISSKNREIFTLISRNASISNTATLGNGIFVNKNVSVNAFAIIGNNVILNTGCILEHECIISESVHIAPGAVLAGGVTIGEHSFIGANSVIKQGVKIGKNVVVGAGTVVISDIPDNKKVVGNPSRFI